MLAGNDAAHPFAISEEMAKLFPNSGFIREWKKGAARLLSEHTHVRA